MRNDGLTLKKRRMSIGVMLVMFTAIVTTFAVLLPADVLSKHPSLGTFAAVMSKSLPGIKTFADHSPHPEVVSLVLATLWAGLPALIWVNATRVHAFEDWHPPYVASPLRAVPTLIGGLVILAIIVGAMGFSEPRMIQSAKGRAAPVVYGITQSRIGLGVESSLAFLAITWIFIALVRATYLTLNRGEKE